MSDQSQFIVGRVQNIVERSKEIGSTAAVVVGIRAAEVKCACGHTWNAQEGKSLVNVVGGIHLTCPSCKVSGPANARLLRAP